MGRIWILEYNLSSDTPKQNKISQKKKDVVPPILRVAATTAPRPGLGLDGAGRGGAAVGLDARGGWGGAGGRATGSLGPSSGRRVGRICERTSEVAVGPIR